MHFHHWKDLEWVFNMGLRMHFLFVTELKSQEALGC